MSNTASDEAARFWDQSFSAPGFLFGTEPNAYLAGQKHLLAPGMRALAVADGEGRNSVWLAAQGLQVDAFDLSPVAIAKARTLARQAGVEVDFQVSDCDAWDWQPSSYDVVAAIFIQFADPALRGRLFERMAQALKPGGLLIVQGYGQKQLEYGTGGPPECDKLYTEAMLRSAFGHLETIDLAVYEAHLQEGTRHVGRSALIGMVARRPLA